MKKLIEIVFVLDRSGSMYGLEKDTIGGFNSMLDKQRQEENPVLVSTVLFNDECKVIHDRVPLAEITNLTEADYYVGGCTALLDAVGGAIKHISHVHKYIREEDRPQKTLFVITTDGLENASKKYSYGQLKEMIESKQKQEQWKFIFMGANMDAITEAGRLGISKEHAVRYCCDEEGTRRNFEAVGCVLGSFCSSPEADELFMNWKKDIEAYQRKKEGTK